MKNITIVFQAEQERTVATIKHSRITETLAVYNPMGHTELRS